DLRHRRRRAGGDAGRLAEPERIARRSRRPPVSLRLGAALVAAALPPTEGRPHHPCRGAAALPRLGGQHGARHADAGDAVEGRARARYRAGRDVVDPRRQQGLARRLPLDRRPPRQALPHLWEEPVTRTRSGTATIPPTIPGLRGGGSAVPAASALPPRSV